MTYFIRYGYMDSDGASHYNDATAESALHAADIIHRLNPELFDVWTFDTNERKKDCTMQVLHMIKRYVEPCYKDGRDFSPETLRELKKVEEDTKHMPRDKSIKKNFHGEYYFEDGSFKSLTYDSYDAALKAKESRNKHQSRWSRVEPFKE